MSEYSVQRATSDGTLNLLNISIDYFDRTEITVYYDNVLNTTNWSWVGSEDKQITFSPNVPNAVEVSVVRTTDLSELRHSFVGGAAFIAPTLDESLKQVLHIAQEATERSLGGDFYADLNMHGFKVTNLGDAVDSGDAVPLGQLVPIVAPYAASASADAAAAANSADAAAISEANAAISASNAATATVLQVNAGNTKAVLKDSGTGGMYVPTGTTAERPSTPNYGQQRANSTLNIQEWWNGSAWVPMGGGATGGQGNTVFFENDSIVNTNYTITAGKNAISGGPITIGLGVTVTVPVGSTWSIV